MFKERQLTDTVVMVEPNYFGFNPQTIDNAFQHRPTASDTEVKNSAMTEFGKMVDVLTQHDLEVVALTSPLGANGEITPDAVFPNNWFSTHPEGLVLYPMKAPNRRLERQPVALKEKLAGLNIFYPWMLDLTADEDDGQILEGTGSLVLDRNSRIAYALESQRTSELELNKWAETMGYEPHFFHAVDFGDRPVYHTNVVMSVGKDFAVACLEAVKQVNEKESLRRRLLDSGKEVIEISLEQMYSMCGNILQTSSRRGEPLVVMSERARVGFGAESLRRIERYGQIIPVKIDIIETVGGGSARCMMAEIF